MQSTEYSFDHCIVSIDAYRRRRSRTKLPMPFTQTEDEHIRYTMPKTYHIIPTPTTIHIFGEVVCAENAKNCLFARSSTFAHRLSTQIQINDAMERGRTDLWIRRPTLSARRPPCKRACARAFSIAFAFLSISILLVRSNTGFFLGKFFSRCCFSFSVFVSRTFNRHTTHAHTDFVIDVSRIYSILWASHKILMARQWPMDVIIYYMVLCLFTLLGSPKTISNGWCSRHRQNWNEVKWTDTGMRLNYCAVTAIYLLLFHILCRRSHIIHNFVRSLPLHLLPLDRISTGCIALSIDCIEKCAIAALTLHGVYRLRVVRKSTCDVWWPMSQSISLLLLISIRCIHGIRIRIEEMQSSYTLPNYWPSIQRCEAIVLLADLGEIGSAAAAESIWLFWNVSRDIFGVVANERMFWNWLSMQQLTHRQYLIAAFGKCSDSQYDGIPFKIRFTYRNIVNVIDIILYSKYTKMLWKQVGETIYLCLTTTCNWI